MSDTAAATASPLTVCSVYTWNLFAERDILWNVSVISMPFSFTYYNNDDDDDDDDDN